MLFIGHGSPMNAIEENLYTRGWKALAAALPRPSAIAVLSAHWFVPGTRVNNDPHPRTVHDMYGFPKARYELSYAVAGATALADEARGLRGNGAVVDNGWGLDHGAWSVLHVMYPQADLPVFQVSIDSEALPQAHYELGRRLAPLRRKSVLLLASGNIVHNLQLVDFGAAGGLPWAVDFDGWVKERVLSRQHADLLEYGRAGKSAALAVPTPDHYQPLLYLLGASRPEEAVAAHLESCVYGSLSMTCYRFG